MKQKEFDFESKIFIIDSLTNVSVPLYDVKNIDLQKIFSSWQETKYKMWSRWWKNYYLNKELKNGKS